MKNIEKVFDSRILSRRKRNRRNRKWLGFEPLESRRMLANLSLTDIFMINTQGERIELADEGQFVYIGMTFTTNAIPAGASYGIRTTMNGQDGDHTLSWGEGLTFQGYWVFVWSLGTVVPGENVLQVTMDPTNQFDEVSEDDNSLTLRFIAPDATDPMFINSVGGVPNQDWRIDNRVDVVPGPGFADYRGLSETYNGYSAQDVGLAAGWEQQASGTPVYASSGGTVTNMRDGGADQCGHPTANQCGPNNFVTIDHGGGWATVYSHLRKDSIAVAVGETVATGQFLGFVGSSGNSPSPQLSWSVYHIGTVIEPYQRPNELLSDPVPYTGEAPSIMDLRVALAGATNGRAEQEVFLPNETPAVIMRTQGIIPGVRHDVIWYRPDGTEYTRWTRTTGTPKEITLSYPLSNELGMWTVATEINGVKQAEATFLRSAAKKPEVKVTSRATNFSQVLDGSIAPIHFDPVAPGRIGSSRTFTVRNVGNLPLSTAGLSIPSGYTLLEPLSPTIAPSQEDTFTVRMDSSSPGLKSGTISFVTNDSDESLFDFPVRGLVTSLSLSMMVPYINENGGPNAMIGTVTRENFGLDLPMTVYLNSSDTSEAKVPLRVTIPAGQTSVNFPIEAVHDEVLDGPRTTTLTASLVGNVSTSQVLTVTDYETLTFEILPGNMTEAAGIRTATITRSDFGSLRKSVDVNLFSSDLTELRVPNTVTIPAGQTSVEFPVTFMNDALADGVQTVTISAVARGYVASDTNIQVVDDEIATLSMSLSTTLIVENGGTTIATITRNTPTFSPLTVTLISSDTSEVTVPSSVIIPVGASSTTFTVYAVNDIIVDGSQAATISATAVSMVSSSLVLTVADDDVPTLGLSVPTRTISENGGSSFASVVRNTPIDTPLTVNLSSSDTSEAVVPAFVVIPVGASSATFEIMAINDQIIDGTQILAITASSLGFTTVTSEISVTDSGSVTAALGLSLESSTMSESGGKVLATVTRAVATSSALVVNLHSSDTTAATVPLTVVIPAGASSATFNITAVNDIIADDSQSSLITASAAGFSSATATIIVSDDEVVTVPSPISIIDYGDASFSQTGFLSYRTGFRGELAYAAANSSASATWHFTNLTPGAYRVSATWIPHANRATNAPFTVDGTNVVVNQRLAPSSFVDSGAAWHDLTNVSISDGDLTVSLGTTANGFVIADAIRIERVSSTSTIIVRDDLDSGFTASGFVPYSQGYAGRLLYAAAGSDAQANWNVGGLEPGIYRVSATWIPHFNRATNAPFSVNGSVVRVNQRNIPNDLSDQGANWSHLGVFTVSGNTISIQLTNDANGFVIADAIRVERVESSLSLSSIIDNGDTGYISSGFERYAAGHKGDLEYAASNSGANATWTFNNLVAGEYRVSATWKPHTNRATNSPYSINGGSPILINQRNAPNQFSDSESEWQDIGTVTITGNQIVVRLSADSTNGFVIADAIRIERIMPLIPTPQGQQLSSQDINYYAAVDEVLAEDFGR